MEEIPKFLLCKGKKWFVSPAYVGIAPHTMGNGNTFLDGEYRENKYGEELWGNFVGKVFFSLL